MTDNNQDKAANAADQTTTQPEFGVQQIFLKGLSVECPNSPQIFLDDWQPHLDMDLATKANALADDNHEVVLTVTVTVKLKEKVAFLIEAQQAGIFKIANFPADQVRPMLGAYCPNVLYPYVREVITNSVMRAGFPQLYLAPVNFDAMYQQHEQQAATATK